MLFNQSREINFKATSLTGRFFKGRVVDVNDPLKIGRIRVYVNGVHKNLEPTTIPWSLGANSCFSGSNSGGIDIPPLNSRVWVLFCSEDLYSSLYFGASRDLSKQLGPEFLEDYPNCRGYIDDFGNLFVQNKVKGFIKSQLISGATICWDNNGLTIDTSNEGPGVNEQGLNITVRGPANLKCSKDFNVEAQNINFTTDNFKVASKTFVLGGTSSGEVSTSGSLKLEGSSVAIAPGGGTSVNPERVPINDLTQRTKPEI